MRKGFRDPIPKILPLPNPLPQRGPSYPPRDFPSMGKFFNSKQKKFCWQIHSKQFFLLADQQQAIFLLADQQAFFCLLISKQFFCLLINKQNVLLLADQQPKFFLLADQQAKLFLLADQQSNFFGLLITQQKVVRSYLYPRQPVSIQDRTQSTGPTS